MKITCAICKNELNMGVTRIVRTKGKDWVCRECLKKASLSVTASQGKTAEEISARINNISENNVDAYSDHPISEQSKCKNESKGNNGVIYMLKGGNGQLYVYEDKIEIARKGLSGLFWQGIKGSKTIPISQIKSIEIKPARLTMGYIQFGIGGGIENRGTLKDAHSDENTITFSSSKDNAIAQNIKSYIEKQIVEQRKLSSSIILQTSNADEIKKYKELLDQNIITQEEFDAKKKQLLGL